MLFVFYLSLQLAGNIFTDFQWDYLLLEAGFLAIFLPTGSKIIILLFRWLLFRLRFLSGVSKLITADPGWWGLTALNTYFETQPLPHIGAWYAHQLPDWLLKAGTAGTLLIELVVPFFMFLPRKWRLTAAALTLIWQFLILITSNHNFFNLLTIILCLFLLDDKVVSWLLPKSLVLRASNNSTIPREVARTSTWFSMLLAAVIFPASIAMAWGMLVKQDLSAPLTNVVRMIQPYHIVHRYHVFPTINTRRIELLIEGSMDGREWRPYRFRYKLNGEDDYPPFVMPHQPRLDWMMWFVPSGGVFASWFDSFLRRLLDESPAVIQLLHDDPFPDGKPRFLRISGIEYRFSTIEELNLTGRWWQPVGYLGPFPPLPWIEAVNR